MATVITNATDLQNMKNDLAGDYELANDIDAGETAAWNGGAGFEPVGNSATPFTGSFDGKGHIITGLTINRATTNIIGLFGKAYNAKFRNVILASCSISGKAYVGALLGWGYESGGGSLIISNAHSSGTITAINGGGGGLVGLLTDGDVTDSGSSCAVDCNNDYAGGFAGEIGSGTYVSIKRCYATGNVFTTACYAGGFAGRIGTNASITQAYATGNVDIDGAYAAGGFVGYSRLATLEDLYARGNVTSSDPTASSIGGFMGHLNGAVPTRCYSTGIPTGQVGYTGGFLGWLQSGGISNCLWDTQTSGTAIGVGNGPISGLTGKTTSQMKDINTILDAGWSIPTIWNVCSTCNNGYPCLVGVNPCCPVSAIPPVDPTIAPKKVSLELIRNLEIMNCARFYISKSGNAVYESRFHR